MGDLKMKVHFHLLKIGDTFRVNKRDTTPFIIYKFDDILWWNKIVFKKSKPYISSYPTNHEN